MIRINILPQKLKNEIKLKVLNGFFKKIVNTIVLCALLFYLFLFGGEYYLKMHYEEISNQNEGKSEDSEKYSKKIKNINSQINLIKKIQENEIDWTDTIIKISQLVNNGIGIRNLSIDKTSEMIVVSGKADTRDSLLLFKNNLEQSGAFSEVKLPIRTMLEQSDIDFEIQTALNFYEFK